MPHSSPSNYPRKDSPFLTSVEAKGQIGSSTSLLTSFSLLSHLKYPTSCHVRLTQHSPNSSLCCRLPSPLTYHGLFSAQAQRSCPIMSRLHSDLPAHENISYTPRRDLHVVAAGPLSPPFLLFPRLPCRLTQFQPHQPPCRSSNVAVLRLLRAFDITVPSAWTSLLQHPSQCPAAFDFIQMPPRLKLQPLKPSPCPSLPYAFTSALKSPSYYSLFNQFFVIAYCSFPQ